MEWTKDFYTKQYKLLAVCRREWKGGLTEPKIDKKRAVRQAQKALKKGKNSEVQQVIRSI